uniref:Neuromedin U C-terminal domain-containing protein n=1 Tax=Myripristis murdjan TaxID=586833 RepID=A0A668A9J1_9TELE
MCEQERKRINDCFLFLCANALHNNFRGNVNYVYDICNPCPLLILIMFLYVRLCVCVCVCVCVCICQSSVLHPLLQLVPQLHTRRERGVSVRADLQGPGGIQSRGYFLYRPRNGRRSLEYD